MSTLGRAPSGFMEAILAPYLAVLRHRPILWRTTAIEVRARYAGSVLGLKWVFVGPLLLLGLYTLIFAVNFRVRPFDMTVSEYVIYVFSGLVPFLAFSIALTLGTLSLSVTKEILLNTVFPPDVIPLRSVLVASVGLPAAKVILLLGDGAFSRLTWTWLLVPL